MFEISIEGRVLSGPKVFGGNRGGRDGVIIELCVFNCLINKNSINFVVKFGGEHTLLASMQINLEGFGNYFRNSVRSRGL